MTSATEFLTFDGLACTACAMCVLAPDALEKGGGGITNCPARMPLSGASPARTSAQQAKAQVFALARALVFGSSSRVLLANYAPALSCWKTSQLSLPGMEMSLLERLPRWGMTRDGALYERPTPVLLTSESDGSAWPTPSATIDTNPRTAGNGEVYLSSGMTLRRKNTNGTSSNLGLAYTVENWPTPTINGNYNRKGAGPNSGDGLATAVWGTPRASDAKGTGPHGSPSQQYDKDRSNLRGQVSTAQREGQLNPDWVETLMGFPPGWTDPTIAYTSRDLGNLSTTGNPPESPAAATSEPAA